MKALKYIYTSKQCSDVSDFDMAITQVKELANGSYTPALRRRLQSLLSGRQRFKNS